MKYRTYFGRRQDRKYKHILYKIQHQKDICSQSSQSTLELVHDVTLPCLYGQTFKWDPRNFYIKSEAQLESLDIRGYEHIY